MIKNPFMKEMITSIICFFVFITCLPASCPAQGKVFRVEVLQITDLEEIDKVYDGFMKELEKNGFIQGKNLVVQKTVIDFDIGNQTWTQKIKAYLRIKAEGSRIAKEKPELAVTVGTPVTKITKDKIMAAGIPLVFTALAFPLKAGCKSLIEAGPGFTGVTTHLDMKQALKIVKTALPDLRTIGIVYGDYPNGFDMKEAEQEGAALGLTFLARHTGMKNRITPVLRELQNQGAQAFAIPPDPYYALRNYEAAEELIEFSNAAKIPVIGFAIGPLRGPVLSVGVDYEIIGRLTGDYAARVLKEGIKPGTLPIVRQQELTVVVDKGTEKSLGIRMPQTFLQTARTVE